MDQVARNEEDSKSYTKLLERLFNELQEESKEVYENVKSKYNSIISGATSCDLHSVCIRDTGAKIIAFALNESKNLKELNLGFNKIGPEGIKALVEGLKRCHTLETLILGKAKQREERYYVDPKTGNHVLEGLSTARSVGFPAGGVVVDNPIYGGVPINGLMRTSHIAMIGGLGYIIGGVGNMIGKFIRSKISSEPELRTQIVDDPEFDKINNLGTRGTKEIADYLRGSRLRRIDLSYCNIDYNAFQDLVEATNACKTLEYISIKGNSELEGRSFSFRPGVNLEN